MTKNKKLFVKECSDEIQKLWKPKVGDMIYDRNYGKFGIIYDVEINIKIIYVSWLGGDDLSDFTPDENTIWLPSLSQIIAEIEKFPNYVEWWAGEWIKGKSYYFCIARKQGKPIEKVSLTIKLAAIKALKQVLKRER